MARIQKERDVALTEAASSRERAEAAAAAANRAARERDSAATELDVLRERWEKAHQQHQKLTVRRKREKYALSFLLPLNNIFISW